MCGSPHYAATVEATIARLRDASAPPAPVPPTITPDASRVERYCLGCDLSWRGPAPCWSRDRPGVQRDGLSDNDQKSWTYSTTFTSRFNEGEMP